MNTPAIQIRALEKHFGRFHLGPLDLTVPRGAVYGLIGPNGAGKTTTLDLILGMGKEDAGAIKVLGLDHRRDEVAMKQQVAYFSPEVQFQAWGKVERLLQFVRGFYPTWDDAYCQHLLTTLQIGPQEKIRSLSFGSRVKLGLIVALSWHPKLLILDEPSVGLDAVSKKQVYSELLAAVQNEDRTVLISPHNLTDLERFADHIGMIKDGKVLLEGPTWEVVERFRLVDFVSEDVGSFRPASGFFVQKHEQDRWQALVDTRQHSVEAISARGGRQVSSTPVTLEDVFVALAR
jgi:ABC-2 type transport system ATP-binding protein